MITKEQTHTSGHYRDHVKPILKVDASNVDEFGAHYIALVSWGDWDTNKRQIYRKRILIHNSLEYMVDRFKRGAWFNADLPRIIDLYGATNFEVYNNWSGAQLAANYKPLNPCKDEI